MSAQVRTSFPVLSILGIIFVTLKLLGHITWSWWWVTAPFWGPIVLVVAVLALALAFMALHVTASVILKR